MRILASALATAVAIAARAEERPTAIDPGAVAAEPSGEPTREDPSPGNDPELVAARIAWRYFERNTQPSTGLVSSVEGYPSTTAWDLGSSIFAALAARELGLLDDAGLERRLRLVLRTLGTLPLFEGALPNKAYDARTGAMTDYGNQPAAAGIGFSAVDLGRLIAALVLAGDLHPGARDAVERALERWDVCRAVADGELRGVHRGSDGTLQSLQEGRLGYEQYAAKALALVGLDTARARRYGDHLAELPLFGVAVPHDARDRRRYGAVDALVSEPWMLDGLELGLADGGAPLAARVFEVQKRRWERTGIVTALSEEHVDRAPWFVYDGIVADGSSWRTVDPEGKPVAGLRSVSTKAAFALAALHPDDPYSEVLRRAVGGASDPERGWFAGLYEDGGTNRSVSANTNAVVLETILFRRRGPLLAACAECSGRAKWRARIASRRHGCPSPAPVTAPAGSSGAGFGGAGPSPQPAPASAPVRSPRAGDGLRAGGALLLDYRGAEGPGAGGILTVWPWRAGFLRFGGESTPRSDRGDTRLLWGFGWDDWRPGTVSLTVHNWGPLRPDAVPGWRGAEGNLGYKPFRACARTVCLAPIASVTVPFSGGPYGDVRATLTLRGKWFLMGGLGRTIPSVFEGPPGTPRWRLVYGFGRWDWHPGTFFVTYHDWGPTWRAGNGILSVGLNWAF